MNLISIIAVLVAVGVLMYLINRYAAPYIDGKILTILNIAVVVIIVLWLLQVTNILAPLGTIRVG